MKGRQLGKAWYIVPVVVLALIGGSTYFLSKPPSIGYYDGDSIRIGKHLYRIHELNAPELLRPKCEYERALGIKAKDRITELINHARPRPTKHYGEDGLGRPMVDMAFGRIDWADTLISEGLAVRDYVDDKKTHFWCDTEK